MYISGVMKTHYLKQSASLSKQIELSLIDCGLIANYNYKSDCGDEKCPSPYRPYFHLVWRIFHLSYLIFCMICFQRGRMTKSHLDFVYLIDGNVQFLYLSLIIFLLVSLTVVLIFNFTGLKTRDQWLRILMAMDSFETLKAYGISDKHQWNKLNNRVYLVFKFGQYNTKLAPVLMAGCGLLVCALSYNVGDFVIYGTLSSFNMFVIGQAICQTYISSFACFFIIIDFCRVRFKILNSSLQSKNSGINFFILIKEHNSICKSMAMFNRFWRTFYLNYIFITLPGNSMMLHELLFSTSTNFILLFTLSEGVMFVSVSNLIINTMAANVNKEANKSYRNLLRISRVNKLGLRHNIKVKNFIM